MGAKSRLLNRMGHLGGLRLIKLHKNALFFKNSPKLTPKSAVYKVPTRRDALKLTFGLTQNATAIH
jgi:hypothetical protein